MKWMVVAALVACTSKPKVQTEEFYGITFTVPLGSSLANTGNSLPGPEPEPDPVGPGEEPKPVPPPYIHPGVSVNELGAEIWKDPGPSTLAAMQQWLKARPEIISVDEALARPDGYDLTYTWKNTTDGSIAKIFTRYFQFSDEQYTCKYYSTSPKVAESEKVCRSIRKKR